MSGILSSTMKYEQSENNMDFVHGITYIEGNMCDQRC